MEAEAAKFLGAGIAAIALAGAGIGLGNIFGKFFEGSFRNPSAAAQNQQTLLLGFALTEFTGILAFVVAMLLIFVA